MANISKIKTPDGTTYELASKEENIQWGGNNVVGSVSPIGMSLSADHSANRIAFINGDLLSVEGSTDNGNTWTDYGLSKAAKTSFCTSSQNIHIGTNSAEACTLNSKLRITLTAQDGTNPSNRVYTNPKKLLVNVSSANGLEVLIEVRTGTNYLNNGEWKTWGIYTVSGWSGWNDIPLIMWSLGGDSTQTSNYWQLRLTFSVTSLHSSEQSRSSCYVSAIRIYGDNAWTTPSNMARHNHIYDYDYNQNTTFPANVTAPKFIGALQGNADTATSATSATTATKLGSSNVGSATQPIYLDSGTATACTHTLGKSVPSDAVFTDTKNTAGSTDTSSKIYLVGATSQAANPQTYSHDTVYVDTDGCLYSGGNKVLTSAPVTSVAGKTGAVTLTASDVGALASTTKYAGASTAGGSATSAAKLDTTTSGSATQPCYFSNGVPNACTYNLNKDVPSNAVFTDKNVEQIVSTGESSAFLRILTSPFQTDSSETMTSFVAASNFATISAQYNTIQLDGGQLLACDSNDSTKYLIFSSNDIYNHKTWDGNNTDLTDALADKANTADVYTQTQVNNLLADKQDSLLGGNISSGADLNDYRTAGNYWNNNTSISNLPVAKYGMLEVIPKDTGTATAVIQRYTSVSNNSITGVYERIYVSGAWRAWEQIGEDTFLPLAGGTLTGDLTIEKATPSYYTKKTGLTIDKSSNNGLTSDTSSYIINTDSTNSYFGRFRTTAYSDGRVASLVESRNMKTDENRVANYLSVGVNKDGTRYFAFPNDSAGDGRKAFREALNIKDTPTILEPDISSSQTVSSGNYKSLGSFTLTTGTWIVSYKAEFAADASGFRRIMLTSSSGSNSPINDSRITVHAMLNSVIDIGWTTMIRVAGTSVTRYLTAYQNSGDDLTVKGYVKAVKVINV